MKDLKHLGENHKEMDLIEQAAAAKPQFATKEEAIDFYTRKLENLAKQCGRTVSEMLTRAENSPEIDESCDEAMELWSTLSLLKRK